MTRYLRPDIYGGISECRSPEEKVGYGRCTHLPGEESPVINYDRSSRANYVEVKGSNEPPEIARRKSEIKTFINKVRKNNFSDEKVRDIISRIS